MGLLEQPARVLSPPFVTSVAHPCTLCSHKDGQRWLMWLRHSCELGKAWIDPGCKKGDAGTGCCGTPGTRPQPAQKHHCPLGKLQGWAGASLPCLCRTRGANSSAFPTLPAHRGRGKEENKHLTGCQLHRRAPEAPKQPPCSVHGPQSTHSPHKQHSPPHQSPPPKSHGHHAQQSPAEPSQSPAPSPAATPRTRSTFCRSSLLRTLPQSRAPVFGGRFPSGSSTPRSGCCSPPGPGLPSGCTNTSVIATAASAPGRRHEAGRGASPRLG